MDTKSKSGLSATQSLTTEKMASGTKPTQKGWAVLRASNGRSDEIAVERWMAHGGQEARERGTRDESRMTEEGVVGDDKGRRDESGMTE